MGIEFTLIHKDNVPHPVEQVAHESQFLHESASYRVRARGCALLVTSSPRRDYLTERGRLDKKKKGQREIERKIQTVDSSSNGSYNSNSSHPHVRAAHESAQRPHARFNGSTRLPPSWRCWADQARDLNTQAILQLLWHHRPTTHLTTERIDRVDERREPSPSQLIVFIHP